MSDATPIDAALEGLSELAASDLRLAKRFAARIEALPDDEDDKANNLARSYQRMARSYRQTLAMTLRMRRELKAEDKDAAVHRDAAAWSHRNRVRRHFERALWDEYEDDEAEEIFSDLDERLGELAGEAAFLETPVETLIARLTEEFAVGAEDEADDEDPAVSPSGGKRREGPQGRVADGGSEGETADPPAEAPPDPDPPPRPPDPPPPEPDIPPWEKLRPGQRWPGGSGW